MSSTKKPKKTDAELLELGQKLRDFYEMGYVNSKQALWFSFLKGMASGFGAVLGSTILLAIFIGLLSYFTNVPLLGHLVQLLRNNVQHAKR